MLKSYSKRFTRLIIGLFLYGLGIYFSIQANIGLAPWDAFSMGVSLATSISFGDVVIYSGLVIVLLDFLLKEKIGFGTLLNTILIGKFVDLIAYVSPMEQLHNFWAGIGLLLFGQFVISLASYLYIGTGLGCGPRDALMVALCKRFPKAPVGLIRAAIEGSVLLCGFLLGAKIGLGTVIAVFGMGFIMQWTFHLLHFGVRAIPHEDFADTLRNWGVPLKKKESTKEAEDDTQKIIQEAKEELNIP